jgi:hypothetical protein
MAKAHKYKGVLAKPMQVDAGFGQFPIRLRAIFAEFGIERIDSAGWQMLALELAKRHVPGFQMTSAAMTGPGRRVTTTQIIDDVELVYAMDSILGKGDPTILSAAEQVAKNRKRREKPLALEAKYRRLKKEIAQPTTSQTSSSQIRTLLLEIKTWGEKTA